MADRTVAVAGVDVGTECVKAIILDAEGKVLGRTVRATRGYFQDRVREALDGALDDAGLTQPELAGIGATGFAKDCVAGATTTAPETVCHALGVFQQFPEEMCVVDIGGRDPEVIRIDGEGKVMDIHTVRRCAIGIGTFLMYSARHLDVHPTRLQELAAAAERAAPVGSYCSVFGGSDILDRLHEGATREEVALGCMYSVAERIVEIGNFDVPLRVTGGVIEYFPGVLRALAEITEMEVEAVLQPIMTGAHGVALLAREARESAASS